MNSLSELNSYSDTLISYTDLRTAAVVFDKATATNQTASYATNQSHYVPLGINILDIVLPEVEHVSLDVNLSLASGASLEFDSLPAGYTVNNYGPGYYRISNIQSAADWNLIKMMRVVTASGYDDNFNYYVTIGYEGTKSKSWTVATSNTNQAFVTGTFSVYAECRKTGESLSNMVARSTVFCRPIVGTSSTPNVTATLAATITKIPGYISTMESRSYIANKANPLFATNTPRLTDDSPSGTYTITFNSANGNFGTISSQSSTYTFTGTFAQVNAQFSNIYFWPTKDFTSSTTFTYTQVKAGFTQVSKSVPLTYASTSTYNQLYTFTASSTWTPTLEEYTYLKADVLIVGGGGGGIVGRGYGSGGGGGGVRELTNQAIANTTYTVTIGAGGAANNSKFNPASGPPAGPYTGTTGGTSSAFGYSATGGEGGYWYYSGVSTGSAKGGNSGTPANGSSNYTGANGTAPYTGSNQYGGSGAGAGANGNAGAAYLIPGDPNYYGGNGGSGKLSAITGQYYGGGGGAATRYYLAGGNPTYNTLSGNGGAGGGGNAGRYVTTLPARNGLDGLANTGGGGGGGGVYSTPTTDTIAGNGGSGVVVIKIHS